MEKEYKNSEKNTYKYLGDLPFGKKKVRFPNLPNARWIKYVEKEFIKVAEENIGKY